MEKMKVIVLEPMKEAYVAEIENELSGMQKVVGDISKVSIHLKKRYVSL